MKRLYCCFCLLLCLCLLFPVFSISTSAISVDGYDVSTRVVNESGVYEEFTNTIVFNTSTNQLFITVDIELPEVIPENTIFDLEIEFSIGDYLTISEYNGGGTMYDSNWVQLEGRLDGIVRDGKLVESQIVALGDIKYIRYVFDIYNPFFNVVSKDSSFSSAVDLYGTTWKFNDSLSMPSQRIYVYSDESSDTICHYDLFVPSFSKFYYGYPVATSAYFSGIYYSFQVMNQNNVSSVGQQDGSSIGVDLSSLAGSEITFHSGFNVTDSFIDWFQSNASLLTPNNGSSQYSFDFAVNSISLTKEDNTGVIGGIFGWIQRIFSAISDIPNQIGKKLTSFGEWFIDQIKGLFVPSEEAIIEMKDKSEALLADRFGAAYQSIEVVDQFGQAMGISTYSDTKSTITFPSVSVPLVGTVFTFGGWEVDIVPDGFEELVIALKLITDLVCTVAFVNAFRRRMESVLR